MSEPDKKSPADKTPPSQEKSPDTPTSVKMSQSGNNVHQSSFPNKTLFSQEKCSDTPKPQKLSNAPNPQKVSLSRNNFLPHLKSILENFKSTLKRFLDTAMKKPAITSNLLSLITSTEKIVKNFYSGIIKKVTDFADNDLQKFKTMSKEETEKTRKILLQYTASLQKNSDEKLKQLKETKERLEKNIFKREELNFITKFFDAKLTEVKKVTHELYNCLSKGEAAPFVKDLQKMVETQSTMMKSSINSMLETAKGNIPKLQESLKSVSTKGFLSKLPKVPDNYKLSTPFSKKVVVDPQATNAVKKSMVSLKNKIQFNISKLINSDITYGRTNVTKATYASIILFYLYRKFNRGEVVET